MEAKLIQNALAYAARYQLQFAERLGFSIHGIIFSVVGNRKDGTNVIASIPMVDLTTSNIAFEK